MMHNNGVSFECSVFQRKPEESPVKESVVKKVKQNDGQTNEVHEAQTNGVQNANGDTNGQT